MNIKEKIDFIVREYDRVLKNNMPTPGYLEKQNKAVEMIANDNCAGLYLLKEGLSEEREWITNMLMNEG